MSEKSTGIDFSEIKSHTEFEDFAADLLQAMNFQIELPPGEGNDGGKDLIVSQALTGRFASKKIKYLVSCKHQKAAIGTKDEPDIPGRVRKLGCQAFIGIYSSHLSQTTVDDFDGYKRHWIGDGLFDIIVLTGAEIRRELYENAAGPRLVRQYFPKAHLAYLKSVTESYVFRLRPVFRCCVCKDDILEELDGSIVYELSRGSSNDPHVPSEWESSREYLHDIKPFCKRHTPDPATRLPSQMVLSIERLLDPTEYSRRVSADIGRLQFKGPYFVNDTVFRKWIHLTQGLFYFVARGKPAPQPSSSLIFQTRYEL